MKKPRLDEPWKAWLKENIARKCSLEELLEILAKNDFSLEAIKQAMGAYYPVHSPILEKYGEKPRAIDYQALCDIRLTRPHRTLAVRRFPSEAVQLYTIDDFMSEAACAALIDIISRSLRASTITVAAIDKYFRTSSTSDLSLLNDETVDALDARIAEIVGIRPRFSEGIQGQHYAVGQEFKEHTDYFEPATDEYASFARTLGNRTWTFMVYLNDVTKGGGTRFTKLDHVFQPRRGQAVVWNNLHADGSPNGATLHAGLPVEEGSKTVITKWFRERGGGEMFYRG